MGRERKEGRGDSGKNVSNYPFSSSPHHVGVVGMEEHFHNLVPGGGGGGGKKNKGDNTHMCTRKRTCVHKHTHTLSGTMERIYSRNISHLYCCFSAFVIPLATLAADTRTVATTNNEHIPRPFILPFVHTHTAPLHRVFRDRVAGH